MPPRYHPDTITCAHDQGRCRRCAHDFTRHIYAWFTTPSVLRISCGDISPMIAPDDEETLKGKYMNAVFVTDVRCIITEKHGG